MGAVLAVCLAMVVGASFFAYKNLYFAGKVVKGQAYLSSVVTGSNYVCSMRWRRGGNYIYIASSSIQEFLKYSVLLVVYLSRAIIG